MVGRLGLEITMQPLELQLQEQDLHVTIHLQVLRPRRALVQMPVYH